MNTWGDGFWGEGTWANGNRNITTYDRNIRTAENEWDSAVDFATQSNTHRLVERLLSAYQEVDDNIEHIYEQTHINTATGAELDQFGDLVNVERKTNENDKKFRARIKATFRASTMGTTFNQFTEFCAETINTDVDNLFFVTDYKNNPTTVTVGAERSVYETSGFTKNEIIELLSKGVPAGHKVTVVTGGSFRLKSDGETDDPEAGLTSDTIDEGGTLVGEI